MPFVMHAMAYVCYTSPIRSLYRMMSRGTRSLSVYCALLGLQNFLEWIMPGYASPSAEQGGFRSLQWPNAMGHRGPFNSPERNCSWFLNTFKLVGSTAAGRKLFQSFTTRWEKEYFLKCCFCSLSATASGAHSASCQE